MAGIKWIDKPYVVRLAPDGWKEKLTCFSEAENIQAEHETDRLSFFLRKLKPLAEGARQGRQGCRKVPTVGIAKIYEIDPMVCPKCASPMKIIAVITDPDEVKKILKHLIKIGRRCP